jgi:hypothetical protein
MTKNKIMKQSTDNGVDFELEQITTEKPQTLNEVNNLIIKRLEEKVQIQEKIIIRLKTRIKILEL